jgi:capsular polysaccharide biosynthesis protein
MNNLSKQQNNTADQDEIDFIKLFNILWDSKIQISVISSIFALISILIALMLPNIYKSEAILMSKESNGSGGMGGMLSAYSDVAGLAGISLPSSPSSKSQEAIARMQSFEFFSNHFLPLIDLENLMAVKGWDPIDNKLTYKEDIFDPDSDEWVRKVSFPKSVIPSSQEAFKTYSKIIEITEDKKTAFISLSVEHFSPHIAKKWASIIIERIDQAMRSQDREEATRAVEYLTTTAPTMNYGEVKKGLASLQHDQMKQLMMIEAHEDYIFTVLDSPIAPENKSKPQRALIVILGTILGTMLGIFFSIILNKRD